MCLVATPEHTLRIGELARRTGLSPEVLRAWERRYALLQPTRTAGGFRLYGHADLDRVRRTKALVASGLGVAEAARLARGGEARRPDSAIETDERAELAGRLDAALLSFDGEGGHVALDRLLGALTLETAIEAVLLPAVARLGARWAAGEISVAQEHFASNLVRARLLTFAVGWDQGGGRRALLACPPGELHDIALVAFGVALHRQGWRIVYLGPDTPVSDLSEAARTVEPALIVLAATDGRRFEPIRREVARLARRSSLAIAGAGASAALARSLGVRHLADGPVAAARAFA